VNSEYNVHPFLLRSVLLWIRGFSAVGVTKGSFAAWWQSTMPLVAKGSIFAVLQSIAMGGTGAATWTIGGLATALGASTELAGSLALEVCGDAL
jgi:hypothetical protein